MMSPLSRRLTVPTKIFSPRDRKSLSSCSRSASRIFCRITCLAACAPMRPIGTDSIGFLDVVAFLDVGDAVQRLGQQLLGIGVLQAGLVGHHQPAAEGLVVAGVAVDRDADVDLAAVQLLGGRGERGLDRAEHDVAFDGLLARDGVHQHQHFAIHRFPSLRHPPCAAASAALRPPGRRPGPATLEIHHRHEPRLAHLVERETQHLLGPVGRGGGRRRLAGALADGLAPARRRLAFGSTRPSRRLPPPAEHALPDLAALERQLERQADFLPGEALVVGLPPQRAVEPRRRNLQPRVGQASTSSAYCSWRVTCSQSSTVTNSPSPLP